jgi:hypothetical protein
MATSSLHTSRPSSLRGNQYRLHNSTTIAEAYLETRSIRQTPSELYHRPTDFIPERRMPPAMPGGPSRPPGTAPPRAAHCSVVIVGVGMGVGVGGFDSGGGSGFDGTFPGVGATEAGHEGWTSGAGLDDSIAPAHSECHDCD